MRFVRHCCRHLSGRKDLRSRTRNFIPCRNERNGSRHKEALRNTHRYSDGTYRSSGRLDQRDQSKIKCFSAVSAKRQHFSAFSRLPRCAPKKYQPANADKKPHQTGCLLSIFFIRIQESVFQFPQLLGKIHIIFVRIFKSPQFSPHQIDLAAAFRLNLLERRQIID